LWDLLHERFFHMPGCAGVFFDTLYDSPRKNAAFQAK
jgi:hypothetical protein